VKLQIFDITKIFTIFVLSFFPLGSSCVLSKNTLLFALFSTEIRTNTVKNALVFDYQFGSFFIVGGFLPSVVFFY